MGQDRLRLPGLFQFQAAGPLKPSAYTRSLAAATFWFKKRPCSSAKGPAPGTRWPPRCRADFVGWDQESGGPGSSGRLCSNAVTCSAGQKRTCLTGLNGARPARAATGEEPRLDSHRASGAVHQGCRCRAAACRPQRSGQPQGGLPPNGDPVSGVGRCRHTGGQCAAHSPPSSGPGHVAR